MYFTDLSVPDRIAYTKKEFLVIVKSVFENPESLKSFVDQKKLSNEQSKLIFKFVNKLNSKTCMCCRKFDQSKLQMGPVERELEPLLDIAQTNVKAKAY